MWPENRGGLRILLGAVAGTGAYMIVYFGMDPRLALIGVIGIYAAMFVEHKTNLIGDTLSKIDFKAGKRRRSAEQARTQSMGQQGAMMRRPPHDEQDKT